MSSIVYEMCMVNIVERAKEQGRNHREDSGNMKELVIISGKGGTGKTSVAASFAVLADRPVIADCDVDAADLHLVLGPKVRRREKFMSGREAIIRQEVCIRCGACLTYCRFGAVLKHGNAAGDAVFSIDPAACEGCGVCVRFCPTSAIAFPERLCGEYMVSETRCGPMVHARLGIAGENSGKLVSTVRQEARRIAEEENRPLVIVDGPPGVGCPVIASLGGASLALVVTEPTVSGEHDLERILALTRHFNVRAAVCMNKWDINPSMTEKIERVVTGHAASVIGRIPYDQAVTAAQMHGTTVIEDSNGPAAESVRHVWETICRIIS